MAAMKEIYDSMREELARAYVPAAVAIGCACGLGRERAEDIWIDIAYDAMDGAEGMAEYALELASCMKYFTCVSMERDW